MDRYLRLSLSLSLCRSFSFLRVAPPRLLLQTKTKHKTLLNSYTPRTNTRKKKKEKKERKKKKNMDGKKQAGTGDRSMVVLRKSCVSANTALTRNWKRRADGTAWLPARSVEKQPAFRDANQNQRTNCSRSSCDRSWDGKHRETKPKPRFSNQHASKATQNGTSIGVDHSRCLSVCLSSDVACRC